MEARRPIGAFTQFALLCLQNNISSNIYSSIFYSGSLIVPPSMLLRRVLTVVLHFTVKSLPGFRGWKKSSNAPGHINKKYELSEKFEGWQSCGSRLAKAGVELLGEGLEIFLSTPNRSTIRNPSIISNPPPTATFNSIMHAEESLDLCHHPPTTHF